MHLLVGIQHRLHHAGVHRPRNRIPEGYARLRFQKVAQACSSPLLSPIVQFAATQVSQAVVPQWIGQSKIYYHFPSKFEGGLVLYYGSYRDYWNPNLNGVLRTFNVYVGPSW